MQTLPQEAMECEKVIVSFSSWSYHASLTAMMNGARILLQHRTQAHGS